MRAEAAKQKPPAMPAAHGLYRRSMSPGAIGGFGANHNVRQSIVFLNMPAMPVPETYIGGAANLFGPDGSITVDNTRELMTRFLAAFAQWIGRNASS